MAVKTASASVLAATFFFKISTVTFKLAAACSPLINSFGFFTDPGPTTDFGDYATMSTPDILAYPLVQVQLAEPPKQTTSYVFPIVITLILYYNLQH